MSKIESLTDEQQRMMRVVADEWIELALSSAPVDIDAIRKALPLLYERVESGIPPLIIRAQSPLAAQIWASLLKEGGQVHDSVDDSVYDSVHGSVEKSVYESVYESVLDSVRDSVRDSVADSVADSVSTSVYDSVSSSVHGLVGASVRESVRDLGGKVSYTQTAYAADRWWVNLAAYADYYRRVLRIKFTESVNQYIDYQRNSGVFYAIATKGAFVACGGPTELHKDESGQLHCETGPAITWPDGYKIWAWHGTRIPGEWIEQRNQLDPQIALTWKDIEQRRCAAEIIGWERVIDRLSPQVVDADADPAIGTLLQVDLPDSPAARFLRVRCATGRDFCLPVPPECATAIAAQSWMWQVPEDVYRQLELRT